MTNTLTHHGILGMRWGIRRSDSQLGHNPSSAKTKKTAVAEEHKKTVKAHSSKSEPEKKRLSDMDDAELRELIGRLEMEKKYKDLLKGMEARKTSKGKEFVMDVLKQSGKNIATQAATYAIGAMVNKIFDTDIVNPKKGQKDK
jgi:hypothetical protein